MPCWPDDQVEDFLAATRSKIMVFRPTMEEFRDFPRYVQHMEEQGAAKMGVAKIIPPAEWIPCKDVEGKLATSDLIIPHPILQEISSTHSGIYQQMNIEQPGMSIETYRTHAENPFNQPPSGTLDFLEQRYWRGLSFNSPLYGADVQGSLYDKHVESWNIGTGLGDLLQHICADMDVQIPGVNSPYLYFGSWKTSFPWHVEDMDLYSINYLHCGEPKFWYAIPENNAARFETMIQGVYPDFFKVCPQFLRHKMTIVSPKNLARNGIPVNRMVQRAGEFMITFPRGYHSGFNMGFNCAESVNFALDRWIELGKKSKFCTCYSDTVSINMNQFIDSYNKIYQKEVQKVPEKVTKTLEITQEEPLTRILKKKMKARRKASDITWQPIRTGKRGRSRMSVAEKLRNKHRRKSSVWKKRKVKRKYLQRAVRKSVKHAVRHDLLIDPLPSFEVDMEDSEHVKVVKSAVRIPSQPFGESSTPLHKHPCFPRTKWRENALDRLEGCLSNARKVQVESVNVTECEEKRPRSSLLNGLYKDLFGKFSVALAHSIAPELYTRKASSAPGQAESSPNEKQITPSENEITPSESEITPSENEITPLENEITPLEKEITPKEEVLSDEEPFSGAIFPQCGTTDSSRANELPRLENIKQETSEEEEKTLTTQEEEDEAVSRVKPCLEEESLSTSIKEEDEKPCLGEEHHNPLTQVLEDLDRSEETKREIPLEIPVETPVENRRRTRLNKGGRPSNWERAFYDRQAADFRYKREHDNSLTTTEPPAMVQYSCSNDGNQYPCSNDDNFVIQAKPLEDVPLEQVCEESEPSLGLTIEMTTELQDTKADRREVYFKRVRSQNKPTFGSTGPYLNMNKVRKINGEMGQRKKNARARYRSRKLKVSAHYSKDECMRAISWIFDHNYSRADTDRRPENYRAESAKNSYRIIQTSADPAERVSFSGRNFVEIHSRWNTRILSLPHNIMAAFYLIALSGPQTMDPPLSPKPAPTTKPHTIRRRSNLTAPVTRWAREGIRGSTVQARPKQPTGMEQGHVIGRREAASIIDGLGQVSASRDSTATPRVPTDTSRDPTPTAIDFLSSVRQEQLSQLRHSLKRRPRQAGFKPGPPPLLPHFRPASTHSQVDSCGQQFWSGTTRPGAHIQTSGQGPPRGQLHTVLPPNLLPASHPQPRLIPIRRVDTVTQNPSVHCSSSSAGLRSSAGVTSSLDDYSPGGSSIKVTRDFSSRKRNLSRGSSNSDERSDGSKKSGKETLPGSSKGSRDRKASGTKCSRNVMDHGGSGDSRTGDKREKWRTGDWTDWGHSSLPIPPGYIPSEPHQERPSPAWALDSDQYDRTPYGQVWPEPTPPAPPAPRILNPSFDLSSYSSLQRPKVRLAHHHYVPSHRPTQIIEIPRPTRHYSRRSRRPFPVDHPTHANPSVAFGAPTLQHFIPGDDYTCLPTSLMDPDEGLPESSFSPPLCDSLLPVAVPVTVLQSREECRASDPFEFS